MSRPAYSSKANELSPYILIQPYRCSLTIGKDIIKSLGYPKHVCLRINESNRSFAIIPCEANDVMSFKIPEKLFTDDDIQKVYESGSVFLSYKDEFGKETIKLIEAIDYKTYEFYKGEQ